MKEKYKIGELSKLTGTSIDTIRFYEEKGLLIPKFRAASGVRSYDVTAVNTLSFIHTAKELGFSLSEVGDFLEIKTTKSEECSLALEKIVIKEADIDKKISELKKIKKALQKISERCKKNEIGSSCHFLEVLTQKRKFK